MRNIFRLSLLIALAALIPRAAFAGQVPSHIYTGDNIRRQNPSIEKYVGKKLDAYMSGANGPDTSNIMSYAAPGESYIAAHGMGAESHYERTGDLPIVMLVNADTDRERAYALGWMTHWINDYFVHALVNQWGGWFEVADKHHKVLEMLENKYVYSAKSIRSYSPQLIPADTTITGCDLVFDAFKTCFPQKTTYNTPTARADWRRWFFRATSLIRTASDSFMKAADDGTGVNSAWTTWAAFPKMPSQKQYDDIRKFAEFTETTATKPTLTVKVKVYDNKLFKWFLKEWDDAQTSATQYSVQVCTAATGYLGTTDAAQRKAYLDDLHAVLPNVSIDQPRNDFDNSKIYPGNVNAKEVYYECEIIDTSRGGISKSKQTGTELIQLSGNNAGFDGSDSGEVTIEIPVDSDSYKYSLKVSFRGEEPLKDSDLKDYAWIEASGVFGAEVKIDGDKTTKAAVPLKLKATVKADKKTAPLVKLRWSDETNKKKLGDGDAISFVSNETGKFNIRAEAYTAENGKETILSDDTIEVEVTDPDVTITIEGDDSVEPDKPLKLTANVTAEPAIKKALDIRWTDDTGKKSYGKGETITFSAKQPGSYPVRVEAFWPPKPKAAAIRVGDDSKTITVGVVQVKIRIDGDTTALPGQSVPLTAVLEGVQDSDKAGLEIIWSDDTRRMGIGTGTKTKFSANDPGPYKITVEVARKEGGKLKSIGKAEHSITVGAAGPKGNISAKIAGLPDEAVQGGSIQINAANFVSGKDPYPLYDNANATGALALKWQNYWQSTHQKECDAAKKNGTPLLSITPSRPNGWGVESIKVIWKSDPALTITPAETINSAKTSAKLTATGKFTVWGELYLKTLDKPAGELVGETERRVLNVLPPTLTVELKPSKTTLKPGEVVEVRAVVTGGKEPFAFVWTGDHAGTGAVVSTVSRKIGPLPLSVEVTDADGKKGSASVTLTVEGIKAKLLGVQDKVVYGTTGQLGNQIEGVEAPPVSDGLCKKCGQKLGSNPDCMYCVLAQHDPTKDGPIDEASVPQRRDDEPPARTDPCQPPSLPTPKPPEPAAVDPNAPKRMIIWQSEPALTFDPPKSPDGRTTVTYDRIGKVKIWTEIQELIDGAYQTVCETDQVEIEVVPPVFTITFSPEMAKTGTEVKATVNTTPVISEKLLNYVWFTPETSNRMEYAKNAGLIGFKLKDAKPVDLKVEARVPFYGDTLNDNITATFTPSLYLMEAKVTGTKPRVWKEGVGLVDVENTYAVDQNVFIRAEFVGEKPPGEVRYQWTVNDGTTMRSSGLGNEITVSRHEVGSIEAKVETRDPDGAPFGSATAVVSISVSQDDLNKAKEKSNPVAVTVSASKTTIIAGESAKVTAQASGGVPPYSFFWTGECKGQGASVVFSTKKVGEQTLSVGVKDSKGTKAYNSIKFDVRDPALAVKLKVDKTALTVNESVTVTAEVTGGRPPYAYKWSPNVEGSGASPRFTAPEPGASEVVVTVTDAKKKSVSAKAKLTVQVLTPTFTGLPDQVILGAQANASIYYPQSPAGSKINAKPLPTIYWHTEPRVKMRWPSSDTPANTFTFEKLGEVRIWGEIIGRTGKLLGKTTVKTVNVVAPKFVMEFTDLAGGRAYAKVTAPAGVDSSQLVFKWMRPAGGTSSSPTVYEFQPDGKRPTDVLLIIRTRDSGDLVQEIKAQYQPKKGKDDTAKKTAGAKVGKTPVKDETSSDDAKRKAEQEAIQWIEQAKILGANGKIDEAVTLVDKAGKVVPERADAARKVISRNASAFAGNAVANLDFDKAKHLAALGVKLDPDSGAAKQKQADVGKWSSAWDKSGPVRSEFDKLLSRNRVVSAEKSYDEVRGLIAQIPAAPKISPLLKAMGDRYAKARDAQTMAIQPHRRKILGFIGTNAHENAIPLCEEALNGKVVPELYPAQEKEFRDWLKLCRNKIGTKSAAAAKAKSDADTRAAAAAKMKAAADARAAEAQARTAASAAKAKAGAAARLADAKARSGAAAAKVKADADARASAKAMADAAARANAAAAKARADAAARANAAAAKARADTVARADAAAARTRAYAAAAKPKAYAAAAKPKAYVAAAKPKPYVAPAKPIATIVATKPKAYLTAPRPKAYAAPAKPQTATATVNASPLKPTPSSGSPGPGWSRKVLGEISFWIPSNWAKIADLTGDQGAWYIGDKVVPDAGFGVLRQDMGGKLPDGISVQSQSSTSVSGLSATSYIGRAKYKDLFGWLVTMQRPGPSGKPICFIGVAKTALWGTNKTILEKILGTVRIGGNSSASPRPIASKPAPSGPKTVQATLTNHASQNAHIFVEGETFGPQNRLTPGASRRVTVRIPANGRVKFIAGRNGTVIDSKNWDGDPDDTNRIPRVTFDSSEKLSITTVLK